MLLVPAQGLLLCLTGLLLLLLQPGPLSGCCRPVHTPSLLLLLLLIRGVQPDSKLRVNGYPVAWLKCSWACCCCGPCCCGGPCGNSTAGHGQQRNHELKPNFRSDVVCYT